MNSYYGWGNNWGWGNGWGSGYGCNPYGYNPYGYNPYGYGGWGGGSDHSHSLIVSPRPSMSGGGAAGGANVNVVPRSGRLNNDISLLRRPPVEKVKPPVERKDETRPATRERDRNWLENSGTKERQQPDRKERRDRTDRQEREDRTRERSRDTAPSIEPGGGRGNSGGGSRGGGGGGSTPSPRPRR